MDVTIRDIPDEQTEPVTLWREWLARHRAEIDAWRPRALGEAAGDAECYLAVDAAGNVLGVGDTIESAVVDVDRDTRKLLASPTAAADAFDPPAPDLKISDLLTREVQIISVYGGGRALHRFVEKVRSIVS